MKTTAIRLRKTLDTATCAALVMCVSACGGGGTSIGGSLTGLASGNTVVLEDNGANALTLAANGSFQFSQSIGDSASYGVTVSTQPAGQVCSVSNGSGTAGGDGQAVSNVTVACVAMQEVQGSIAGLDAGNVITLSDGPTTVSVSENGGFGFPGNQPVGTAYNTVIIAQPANQTCAVTNAAGTLGASNALPITITCADNAPASAPQ